jgi:hypothetical protein
MISGLDTASATTWSKGLTLLGVGDDSIGGALAVAELLGWRS